MLRIVILLGVSLLTLAAAPARVATTVYGASIFSQSGPVANAFNALGAADGVSAVSGAPEPSAWMLMMLGFTAIAWRLKLRRRAFEAPSGLLGASAG